jgi:hypothetical protein
LDAVILVAEDGVSALIRQLLLFGHRRFAYVPFENHPPSKATFSFDFPFRACNSHLVIEFHSISNDGLLMQNKVYLEAKLGGQQQALPLCPAYGLWRVQPQMAFYNSKKKRKN